MFAIITVALISGAIADRAKFGTWCVFVGIWATLVYFPVAHWVFYFDGVHPEVGGWIATTSEGASTSPAVQPCTSTPAPPRSRWS